NDIWLIEFYAPWCSFCKQLEPVWHQIGSELKSLGSPVNVGKSDATANTGLAKEFKVRGYPAILMWKKNMKYVYSGRRSKDGIMEFTERVAGPTVRSLNSLQLFQHVMKRHDVMFVYVGATSQLKGNFTSAAELLIVHNFFFSAARDVLPKVPHRCALCSTVSSLFSTVFYSEGDGDLMSWINRERFPNYCKMDSYRLYATGESGNSDVITHTPESDDDITVRNFYFGFMDDSDYLTGLMMGDVVVPSFVVVNLSNDGFFLPRGSVDTEKQLLDFLNGVLDGSIQCQGGNGVVQRVGRLIHETKLLLTSLFSQVPLLGCFLVGFLLAIVVFFCYLCCKARRTTSDEDDDDAPVTPSLQRHKKSD
uniref:protein disulfide-isomerase n=1 Tax=Scophthalmus maximus TaxID=52904 RepID=A0A8D3CIJ6_SCOMX